MGEILKLIVPFFSAPTTYSEVLKKLAAFLFYGTFGASFILRRIPEIDAFFHKIESDSIISNIISTIPNYTKFNLPGFMVALFISLIG
ncbi:MAG TPA: hypothetical protein VL996_06280, partial [Methylocella sp.]|nr:hypothetical protein [Methylocella sp.]